MQPPAAPGNPRSPLETAIFVCCLISLGLLVSGTRACQENYVLGAQTRLIETTTPTGTPGDDDDDDGDLITLTPTATPTEEMDETPDPFPTDDFDDDDDLTPTVTPTPTPTATVAATTAAQAFMKSLHELSEQEKAQLDRAARDAKAGIAGNSAGAAGGNWLGQAFQEGATAQESEDADRDGFADWLEIREGSDPDDELSEPQRTPATSLRDLAIPLGLDLPQLTERLEEIGRIYPGEANDSDRDGLADIAESYIGTNPASPDSDGDGILDGREVILRSNPKAADWPQQP